MLDTPIIASVAAKDLRNGDQIRLDGLKYDVVSAPVVVAVYEGGAPAIVRVKVKLTKSGASNTLELDADRSLVILRRGL